MQNLTNIYKKRFKDAIVKSYPFYRPKPVHPYEVLGNFFDAGNIECQLAVLKRLYQSATNTKALKKEPHFIMYDHQLFCELFNATWVIYKTKVKRKDMPLEVTGFVVSGGMLDNCVIRKYLSEDETTNPYLGFFHCYKDFTLGTYHRNLYHWFWFASSREDFLGKDRETKKIYSNVCKILICSWLIYEKELLQMENGEKL